MAADCNADRAEVIGLPHEWLGQHFDSTVGRGGIILRLSEGFLGAFTEYGIEESHVCLFRWFAKLRAMYVYCAKKV